MSIGALSPAAAADAAPVVRDADEVLGSVRHARRAADAAEVQVLVDAVDWAVMNPPLFARDASALYIPTGVGEQPEREDLTAEGVPDVDRAAVGELGLALGVSTQAAQRLLADALELAYRLPHIWTRLVACEVKPWRARKIAQATRPLGRLAAAFVDRELAPLADRTSGPQLEGLIETAMARHDRELAERLASERAEQRGVEIHLDETTLGGLTPITGCLDLADALDLDAALSHEAGQLALWGSEDSLNARRARALGDLAREHLAFTSGENSGSARLAVEEGGGARDERSTPTADRAPRTAPGKRQIVLYAHLTDTAILAMIRQAQNTDSTSCDAQGGASDLVHMGRVENTDAPITAETIREWLKDPNTRAIIRPVLDLAGYQHANSYEVPGRIKEQVRLRDGTCQFPGCHAKALYCQYDHTDSYNHDDPEAGGQTETTGLVLLCQLHHNLKTHHGFTYIVVSTGAVIWRTPHGLRIRRNHDGTVDYLSRHHSRYCDDEDCPSCTPDAGTLGTPAEASVAPQRARCTGDDSGRREKAATPLPGFPPELAPELDDLGPPPF